MQFSVKERKVLITAAGQGIGAQIARTLHAEGARVHLSDIDGASLDAMCRELPGTTATQADVADPAQVARLTDEADEGLGGFDTLINCAGISGPTCPVEDTPLEEWSATLDINTTGTLLCARSAVRVLKRAGGGSIINMASVAGRLGYPFRSAYSASKWGIIGLTKTWAIELGPHDIRVNAILPGMVEGPRLDKVVRDRAQATGKSEAEVRAQFVSDVSLRRSIAPQEVAAMCVFLLSPQGRSISGQAISLDGNVEVAR